LGATTIPIITITWIAALDTKTCKKCRALNGYTWVITADELPHVIAHPHYGDVYDLRYDESLAHGHGPWHCRCQIDIQIDDSDVQQELFLMNQQINSLNNDLQIALQGVLSFQKIIKG
jgi:hypothetical protein